MPKDRPRKTSRKIAEPQKLPKPQPNLWPPIAALAILAYGLYRAIDLRWICDDAFITMRYVKNFVDGNGLVYNIGERMEGYTHFLWLMLLAASKAVGFDPVDASMWLGIAAYAGILVLLLAISFREYKKNPKAIWLPIAAALFALNYDTAEWASGGLETSFYTLLILGAFYLWFYSKFSEQRRLLLTGLTLALISLTRPDGVLFTVVFVGNVLMQGLSPGSATTTRWGRITKSIGLLVLPSIAIGIPYLLWKYFYYGDLLPLTYYAKSANENYFSQGFFYIWLYFRVHFTSAIAFIIAAFFLFRKNPNNGQVKDESHRGSPSVTALVAIIVYLILFVARVGGDFMFARFIIPVVPFVYFVIERGMERMPRHSSRLLSATALLLLLTIFVENRYRTHVLFNVDDSGRVVSDRASTGAGWIRGIGDERWVYYSGRFSNEISNFGAIDVDSKIGEYLEPFFRNLPMTVAIPGAMNVIAYYANYTTAINDYGLTDSAIAHASLSKRGRVGHEKMASEEYLTQRNVDFELGSIVSQLPKHLDVKTIAFEIPQYRLWQLARLVTYNKAVMDQLSNRFASAGNQSHIPLFEQIIPKYVEQELPSRSLRLIEDDYANFQQFYFNRYPDTALSNRFEERIAELKQDSIEHR